MSTIRVAVFAFDDISLFHLSVPSMVMGVCGVSEDRVLYDVRHFALTQGMIRSDQGVSVEVANGLEILDESDIIIIPAWGDPNITAPIELTDALQKQYEKDKLIVGLCLGAFVLGDAGLLDGRAATTHWIAQETFARRFPRALYRPDVLYIDDDNVVTSAGTVAAIDCCLQIVRKKYGSAAANHIARLLVTPPHRPGGQAQYIEKPVAQLPSENRLPKVLEWARKNLSVAISIDELADVAHMSRRTFTRRFREATGTTVTQWLAAERVALAQSLLESSSCSMESIASQVGFGSADLLRRRFREQLGLAPSAYRRLFSEEQKE